tara:strand:+ start:572 stop:1009 length:438 start_codon:yes stop_codon:yes gene_type:complete
MPDINVPPLQIPLIENDRISKSWEFFFSGLGDGLNGRWNYGARKLAKTNLSVEASPQLVSYQGRQVTFSFIWENGATFNNSTMSLNINTTSTGDLSVTEGYLQVWDGSTQIAGAYCKDLIINLPDVVTTNKIIVQGTLLTKIGNT